MPLGSVFFARMDDCLAYAGQNLFDARGDHQCICRKIGAAGPDTRLGRLTKLGKIGNDHKDALPRRSMPSVEATDGRESERRLSYLSIRILLVNSGKARGRKEAKNWRFGMYCCYGQKSRNQLWVFLKREGQRMTIADTGPTTAVMSEMMEEGSAMPD